MKQIMTDYPHCEFPPELICPAVTTDIAAFRLMREETNSYRRDAQPSLQLLLIERGIPPYQGMWALPGGFVRENETIEDCAYREIEEETGVLPKAMIPIEVFSRLDRDPRGRSISHAYAAVVADDTDLPRSGADAARACWFNICLAQTGYDEFGLQLSHERTQLSAKLFLRETHFGRRSFDVLENSGLAFDHAAIIASALSALREIAQYPEALLDLVPEPFTLTALQQVQETITESSTSAANFRRKIAEYVQETDAYTTGAGHRPARLYRRKRTKEDAT